jgi:hypothetical protein
VSVPPGLYTGRMRRLCAVAGVMAWLALSGCGEGESPCPFSEIPDLLPVQGLLVAGQSERLSIMPFAIAGCATGDRSQLFSVSAEVSGPDLMPLPSQAVLGKPGEPATVDFTPVQPGDHHVLVAFHNVGGVHQHELRAVVDQSAGAVPFPVPTSCESLERTLRGTWVCDEDVIRGGTVEARFSSARLAVAGDVVWVVDGTSVQRFVDTGQALALTASVTHSQGEPLFLLPSAEEVVVLHRSFVLQRLVFQGPNQLASTGLTPWDAPLLLAAHSFAPPAVLLREGNRLAVVSHNRFVETSSAFYTRLCPYQLVSEAFARTSEDCHTVPGGTVGFEANVLWMAGDDARFGSNSRFLHRWVWTEGKLVDQAVLHLGTQLELQRHPIKRTSAVPVVSSLPGVTPYRHAAVAWSAERGKLLLQFLGEDIAVPVASSSFLWEPGPALSARAFLRPPFP